MPVSLPLRDGLRIPNRRTELFSQVRAEEGEFLEAEITATLQDYLQDVDVWLDKFLLMRLHRFMARPLPDVVLACEAVPWISVPNPCPGPSEPCFERNPALPSGLMVAVCGRYGLRGIVRRWRLDTRIGKVRDPPSAATPLPPTPTSLCLAVPTEKFAQKSHYYHFRVKSGPKMDIFGSDHNHRQERVLWVACVLGIVPPHHAFFFA